MTLTEIRLHQSQMTKLRAEFMRFWHRHLESKYNRRNPVEKAAAMVQEWHHFKNSENTTR